MFYWLFFLVKYGYILHYFKSMKKYLVFTIREFLGLSNDYEEIMSSQAEILNKLENIDKMSLQNQEMILQSKETSYYDYITFNNILWILFFLGLIGGGFALYNTNLFNNSTLESIKGLSSGNADELKKVQETLLKAVEDGNITHFKNAADIKILIQKATDLLMKKGIDENTSPALDKPVSEIIQPKNGGIVWGDYEN